ncbi:MAG TPA: hypothetical protein VM843_01130 [Flavisolibacter sp.]|jgi:transcriptional accessory protein Tex/SPT6|nr:hypothetical protein [Flavisolibacter sp.]
MALKEKRYKYVEDVIEDYMRLTDEGLELPLLLAKAEEKYISLQSDWNGNVVKKSDAEDAFKVFTQIRKLEDRRAEIKTEYAEVEQTLKAFLTFLNGQQLGYEKKDEVEKMKITYLFWLEDGQIKCNR